MCYNEDENTKKFLREIYTEGETVMNEVPMQIHGNYNAENIQILEGL